MKDVYELQPVDVFRLTLRQTHRRGVFAPHARHAVGVLVKMEDVNELQRVDVFRLTLWHRGVVAPPTRHVVGDRRRHSRRRAPVR